MKIAMSIFQVVYTLGFPMVALWMARRLKWAEILGPVVLCYGYGIILANLGGWFPLDPGLAQAMFENTVPLAIPLLLFSTDFPRWLRMSRATLISFALMVVSVMVSASAAYMLLGGTVDKSHHVSGMLVGMYTGGTPNMNAIGLALKTEKHIYPLVNAADLMLGGIYFFFLISFAKRFFSMFLPPFQAPEPVEGEEVGEEEAHTLSHHFAWREHVGDVSKSFGLAVLIVGASIGVSFGVRGKIDVALVILALTSMGIACSFVPKIRALKGSYELGDYLLLCFATALGSSVNISKMLGQDIGAFLVYTLVVMTGALFLHLVLAMLFRIDVDTAIITSTAGLYGPPFVPAVVRALNNRDVLVSGLTTGLVGYAVGNYLGVALAHLLGGG